MTDEAKIESILSAMDTVMRAISEQKEKLVREATQATCPMKGCECKVRTAKWVIEVGVPLVERLALMCDAGHEWYNRFATEFDDKMVLLRVALYAVPFEASLFREMEAAVEESLKERLTVHE
jgi:hypothetical protein